MCVWNSESVEHTTHGTVATPWGMLTVEINARGICAVRFGGSGQPLAGRWAEVLDAYLVGQPIPLDLPVDLSGVPPFTRAVLDACRQIPFGTTLCYGELAVQLGRPTAARAVGHALARNPVPVVIPCHRVLGAGGRLTGFLGGLAWKRALLAHEGVLVND